jgi:ribosomal protein S18 acetylase RimI-like enzyme
MSLHPRPYSEAELPRLQAALAGWIRAAGPCGYCHAGELAHRIYAHLRGRPPGALVQIWEQDGEVAGVALNGRFGNAFDLFVAPERRGEPELTMLRASSEATRAMLRRAGHEASEVISDVFSCDASRRAQLGRLGFAEYRLWDHITERRLGGPLPAPSLPEGFSVRRAAPEDAAGLAAARNSAFGGEWTAELYRAAFMGRPGYAEARELVVVAPGGDIAAFSILWLDPLNKVGQFEPVGVHRDFQRRGLGRALMLAGLAELGRLGMERAAVEHDATNLAAGALYHGLGFVKRFETLGYRRAYQA